MKEFEIKVLVDIDQCYRLAMNEEEASLQFANLLKLYKRVCHQFFGFRLVEI